MKATIKYALSSAGKAAILAGGNGCENQEITVPQDLPDFRAVVDFGNVRPDGEIIWEIHYTRFDVPQSAAEIVAWKVALVAKEQNEIAKRNAKITAETLAVIAERRVTRHKDKYSVVVDGVRGETTVEYDTVDWPNFRDDAVVSSPEGQAFVAELRAKEVAARAEAETRAQADAVAYKIAKDAAEKIESEEAEKLAAEKIAMGGEATDYRMRIEDGAIVNVPIWESHSRGKNWLAIIAANPSSPGGLSRDFADKAKGDSYYILPSWEVGTAIEFGADYYSGRGRENAQRWYGFVVAASETHVLIRARSTGKEAIRAGNEWAKDHGHLNVVDQVAAGLAKINGEGTIVPENN